MAGPDGGSPSISEPDAVTIGGGLLCWTVTIRFTTYDLASI
jgi:hypothetical protein